MSEQRITYGNWLQPRSPGIAGLGLLGTGVIFAAIPVVIMTIAFSGSFIAAGVEVFVVLLFVLLAAVKFDRRTLLDRIVTSSRFAGRRRRGEHLHVAGALSARPADQRYPLPGVLDSVRVLNGRDGLDRPFAVLYSRSKDTFAVTLRCAPDGVGMMDRDVIDSQVAAYGGWLSSMSTEEGLEGASVIVETAPSSPTLLQDSVAASKVESAPHVAVAVMEEAARTLPAASAEITLYVTLVFRGRQVLHQQGKPEAVVVELARRLPHHIDMLAAAGAGEPIPMTEEELAHVTRTAYDPTLGDVNVQSDPDDPLTLADAGPSVLEEERELLRHDGAASFTYEMMEPPRGLIVDTHLQRLLAPHGAFLRKRVTLLYRRLDAGKGVLVAERASKAAGFNASQEKGRISAESKRGIKLTEKTEEELASGATLVPFSMLTTVTFADDERGSAIARNALKSLVATSKLRMRPCSGLQASAFHVTLPLGLLPWKYATVPLWLKGQI